MDENGGKLLYTEKKISVGKFIEEKYIHKFMWVSEVDDLKAC